MSFDEDLRRGLTDMLLDGDDGDTDAMSNTVRGAMLHQRLGENPTREDCFEAVEAVSKAGLSVSDASMQINVSLKVLGEYDSETFEHIHDAMCETYPEYAEMHEGDN